MVIACQIYNRCLAGPARLASSASNNSPKKLCGAHAKSVRQFAKLQHVELTLPAFDFADERMGPPQSRRQLSLGQSGFETRCRNCRHQCLVTQVPKLFSHAAPVSGAHI